jgi:hypothetical protein
MSTNKKRFSRGWAIGIVLGLASSAAVVLASNIGLTFSSGQTLTAADMNTIVTSANDNDTRITNLQGNAGASPTCVTNNLSDEMVRVGPLCVDKYRASIFTSTAAGGTALADLSTVTTCNADGTDNGGACNIVAQSRSGANGGAPIDGNKITWAQAQRACSNAGKRLLTPGEWMAAYSSGLTADMATVGQEDYVDSVVTGGANTKMRGGYIGPTAGASGIEFSTSGLTYDVVAAVPAIFGFRCAR